MKIFFLSLFTFLVCVSSYAGENDTSVLVADSTTESIATTSATIVTTPITIVTCCDSIEPVKLAKLPPWKVRRLNRIADRQEARDARKCCCDPCTCEKHDAYKCKTRAVVVEARR